MAQLVKLQDYISRYENDLTRYPTQFIRLKRQQWERMKNQWESGSSHSMWEDAPVNSEPIEKKKLTSLLRLFGSREEDQEIETVDNNEIPEEKDFSFTPNLIHQPTTLDQLYSLYLDQLFHFQIKWASSTLMDKSQVKPGYYRDSLLRAFTQQLPDNYLLFYNPILVLQNATIELEIILVSPVECMCISVVEEEDLAVFIGSSDRFWTKKIGEKESKVLNPHISLNRMGKIITQLFSEKEISIPIKKYLISRNGYIDNPTHAYDVEIVDRRMFDEWFSSIRTLKAPLKFAQFQATQAILDAGQTTATSRMFDDEEKGQEEKV